MSFRKMEMPIRSGELLVLRVKNRGSIVPHDKIDVAIWGDFHRNSGLATKYIQRLRRKMGDTSEVPIWLRFLAAKPRLGAKCKPTS